MRMFRYRFTLKRTLFEPLICLVVLIGLTACGSDRICHSWVTDGQIEFLNDSWHELKGQTVPLPEIPDWLKD